MARSRCALTVVLIAAFSRAAAGQEPITLAGAVQAALAHNASLRASRAGVDEAAAQVTEGKSGFFPRISVSESWQRGDQPVFVFSSLLSARHFTAANFAIDALNHPDPVGFFRTTVGVEQLLFSGGRQQATADTAARRLDFARAATDEASSRHRRRHGRGVRPGSSAPRPRTVPPKARLSAGREDLARAERRRDAGLATDADVLALVVHVADLQQRAIQASGDAAVARAELNRLMGNPVEVEIRLATPSTADDGTRAEGADVNALVAEAIAARPEIKRSVASEQIADAARREARSALIPQIAAQAACRHQRHDIQRSRVRLDSWRRGAVDVLHGRRRRRSNTRRGRFPRERRAQSPTTRAPRYRWKWSARVRRLETRPGPRTGRPRRRRSGA